MNEFDTRFMEKFSKIGTIKKLLDWKIYGRI